MSVLDRINAPSGVKDIPESDLPALSEEIREKILSVVKSNGGHLSSNLGIVETTVALYRVFDFEKDKLVFDVGHQCYAHKILSGRKDLFSTVRQKDGISGFPDATESEYDAFSVGHAGTSVSAGLGLCLARDKNKEDFCVINVVGDGAFTNGLNLEAITSSTEKPKNFIVILNDNGMSISKNRNGLYKYISTHTTGKRYIESKNAIKKIFKDSFITRFIRRVKNLIKRILNKDEFFERFGFKYVGVIDGNDIKELEKTLTRVKYYAKNKAVLLHIRTKKGKGVKFSEERADAYHGVGKNFDFSKSDFSVALGEELNNIIEKNDKVVAITAGMSDGTGLKTVEISHPDNFIDVGIAEEFAVTYAAGMAKGGLKPVVALYSTFAQRAYDEIIHDVCIESLPVVFCFDRSGLVGEDGKTHQGVFDISFLSHIPNLTVLSPVSVGDFKTALNYALSLNSPVVIKYPKGKFEDFPTPPYEKGVYTLSVGKDISVLAVGPNMLKLANGFKNVSKYSVGVYAVRTLKPLDGEFLKSISDTLVFVLEENSLIGGFGSAVSEYYFQNNIKPNMKFFGVKDEFIPHMSVNDQMSDSGLTVDNLVAVSRDFLGEKDE